VLDTWRRSIQGALGVLAVSMTLPAQTALFILQNEVPTGANPVSLAIGPFNNDRRLDLAVAQRGSAGVALLQSVGQGFFIQPFPSQATGNDPRVVATGDFNRDGILDLVVANFGSATVSLFLGNGDGTFRPQLDLDASSPSSLVVGDFNRDGLLDLAVSHQTSNSISIFLGNGDATFRAPLTFAVGVSPVSIAVSDFNGDAIPDLAVANATSNSVSILLGNGNGTFRRALNFAAGPTPAYIALGDFNRDGKTDVAVVNDTSAGTMSLLIGNGNGSLQAPLSFAVGPNPSFIVAADFNLDGNLDLAVANTGSDTVSFLMGTGTRAFQPQMEFSAGNGPSWIGVMDFNLDGKPDLVVVNSLSNTISMLANLTPVPHQPSIKDHSVVNAASFRDGSVAPGEVVTIFGSNLGPSRLTAYQLTASHFVSTTLAQTRVLFDGIPAPLLYVRNDQVSAIVPFAVAGQTDTQVVVVHNGIPSGTLTVPVAESAPGLFNAVLNEDSSKNSATNPAAQGSIVVLYGTGAGQTNPAGVDGQIANKVLPKPVLPVTVTIDGKAAKVLYAGGASGEVAGVIQVNVRLPDDIHSGALPVVLRVGSGVSQPGITLAVQ
jgi:uncharacterized protein (TIGR03437 family)